MTKGSSADNSTKHRMDLRNQPGTDAKLNDFRQCRAGRRLRADRVHRNGLGVNA